MKVEIPQSLVEARGLLAAREAEMEVADAAHRRAIVLLHEARQACSREEVEFRNTVERHLVELAATEEG